MIAVSLTLRSETVALRTRASKLQSARPTTAARNSMLQRTNLPWNMPLKVQQTGQPSRVLSSTTKVVLWMKELLLKRRRQLWWKHKPIKKMMWTNNNNHQESININCVRRIQRLTSWLWVHVQARTPLVSVLRLKSPWETLTFSIQILNTITIHQSRSIAVCRTDTNPSWAVKHRWNSLVRQQVLLWTSRCSLRDSTAKVSNRECPQMLRKLSCITRNSQARYSLYLSSILIRRLINKLSLRKLSRYSSLTMTAGSMCYSKQEIGLMHKYNKMLLDRGELRSKSTLSHRKSKLKY